LVLLPVLLVLTSLLQPGDRNAAFAGGDSGRVHRVESRAQRRAGLSGANVKLNPQLDRKRQKQLAQPKPYQMSGVEREIVELKRRAATSRDPLVKQLAKVHIRIPAVNSSVIPAVDERWPRRAPSCSRCSGSR